MFNTKAPEHMKTDATEFESFYWVKRYFYVHDERDGLR